MNTILKALQQPDRLVTNKDLGEYMMIMDVEGLLFDLDIITLGLLNSINIKREEQDEIIKLLYEHISEELMNIRIRNGKINCVCKLESHNKGINNLPLCRITKNTFVLKKYYDKYFGGGGIKLSDVAHDAIDRVRGVMGTTCQMDSLVLTYIWDESRDLMLKAFPKCRLVKRNELGLEVGSKLKQLREVVMNIFCNDFTYYIDEFGETVDCDEDDREKLKCQGVIGSSTMINRWEFDTDIRKRGLMYSIGISDFINVVC